VAPGVLRDIGRIDARAARNIAKRTICDESELFAFGPVHLEGNIFTESNVLALSALTFAISTRDALNEGGARDQERGEHEAE
jgi:hypothetical protein